jgi:hypothetical protein
MFSGF